MAKQYQYPLVKQPAGENYLPTWHSFQELALPPKFEARWPLIAEITVQFVVR